MVEQPKTPEPEVAVPVNPEVPHAPVNSPGPVIKRTNYTPYIIAGVLALLLIVNLVVFIQNNNLKRNISSDEKLIEPTVTLTPSPTAVIETVVPTTLEPKIKTSIPDKLILQDPDPGKLLKASGDSFIVSGEMQNFFEGNLPYRIINSKGVELQMGSVTADTENYDKFAKFYQIVNLIPVPKAKQTETGYIEFFEVSMKDGAETELLKIPLLFDLD